MLLLPVTAQLAQTSDWSRPPPSTGVCWGKAAQRSGGPAKNACCLAQTGGRRLVPQGPRCTGLDLPLRSPPRLCLAASGSAAPATAELRSTPAPAPHHQRGVPGVALTEEAGAGLLMNDAKVEGHSLSKCLRSLRLSRCLCHEAS